MKRKSFITIAFISALLFSVIAGTQVISLSTANPCLFYEERYESPPIVTIHSPVNGSYVNGVLLNVTVTKSEGWLSESIGGLTQKLVKIDYQVDNKFSWRVDVNSDLSSPFNYCSYLTNLTDGSHFLRVYANATGVVFGYYVGRYGVRSVQLARVFATVHFTLDFTPPNVSFLSAERIYTKSEFPLNFTVNESTSQITYSLDGQKKVTITGNTTLTNLPYGAHNVTVYTTDNVGNIGSETINFTIEEPESEPSPMMLVIAPIASVIFVGAGLLVYLKKRKREA